MNPVLGWEQCFAKSTPSGAAGISVAEYWAIARWLSKKMIYGPLWILIDGEQENGNLVDLAGEDVS